MAASPSSLRRMTLSAPPVLESLHVYLNSLEQRQGADWSLLSKAEARALAARINGTAAEQVVARGGSSAPAYINWVLATLSGGFYTAAGSGQWGTLAIGTGSNGNNSYSWLVLPASRVSSLRLRYSPGEGCSVPVSGPAVRVTVTSRLLASPASATGDVQTVLSTTGLTLDTPVKVGSDRFIQAVVCEFWNTTAAAYSTEWTWTASTTNGSAVAFVGTDPCPDVLIIEGGMDAQPGDLLEAQYAIHPDCGPAAPPTYSSITDTFVRGTYPAPLSGSIPSSGFSRWLQTVGYTNFVLTNATAENWQPASLPSVAVLDDAVFDVCDVKVPSNMDWGGGVVFRYRDALNFWYATYATSTTFQIWKVVAGVATMVAVSTVDNTPGVVLAKVRGTYLQAGKGLGRDVWVFDPDLQGPGLVGVWSNRTRLAVPDFDVQARTMLPTTYDSMVRADSATALGGPWSVTSGVLGISGNSLYTVSKTGTLGPTATVDCGSPDQIVEYVQTTSPNSGGAVLRYQDANNYYYCNVNGGTATISKVVGGVQTQISSLAHSAGASVAAGDKVAFAIIGGIFFFIWKGNTRITGENTTGYNDTTFATGNRCGIRGSSTVGTASRTGATYVQGL